MGTEEKSMEVLILKAAEKLFLEQGFEKTTTGQIARLAGCNQALVHYYYRTKDNLFGKIFEEKARMVAASFLAINSDGMTFEEKVTKMVGTHFDFFRQNLGLAPFIFHEVLSNPDRLEYLTERLKQYPESVFTQLDKALKQGIEEGIIRPIRTTDLMFTVLSLNLTPFLIKPVLLKGLNLTEEAYQKVLENRKQEIIETVLSRLRK